jgi:hypothetical protein
LADTAQNTEALQEPYGKRLHRAARVEFRRFWSAYRWWITAVGLVFAVISGEFRLLHKAGTVYDFLAALGWSLLTLLASAAGCYVIAIRKGAEALDAAQANSLIGVQRDTKALRQEVDSLRHTPWLSTLEQSRRDLVENAFRKRSPEHLPLDLAVLRHLLLHGNDNPGQVARGVLDAGTVLPKDIRSDLAVRPSLHRCVSDHLLRRTPAAAPSGDPDRDTSFEVNPDLRDALTFHLFDKTRPPNPQT